MIKGVPPNELAAKIKIKKYIYISYYVSVIKGLATDLWMDVKRLTVSGLSLGEK